MSVFTSSTTESELATRLGEAAMRGMEEVSEFRFNLVIEALVGLLATCVTSMVRTEYHAQIVNDICEELRRKIGMFADPSHLDKSRPN